MNRFLLLIALSVASCAASPPPAAPPAAPSGPTPGSVVIPANVVKPFTESVIICGSGQHPDECVKVLDFIAAATVKPPQENPKK